MSIHFSLRRSEVNHVKIVVEWRPEGLMDSLEPYFDSPFKFDLFRYPIEFSDFLFKSIGPH
ncbi:hypothetical protein J6590_056615 [Homalodisca vitripennis]|nr:hypothetical protein J6590_056615 [Homalodisca vitripennis]